MLASKAWVLVALVTVLGVILRLWGFNAHWPNPDEGLYYSMATWEDWGGFWTEYAENAHPPLFYVLLRVLSWISEDVGVLRGIALVLGCAAVPAMYLFGRECGGGGRVGAVTGLATALLVAVSPGAILMSQVMRPYTLQIASMAFGLYFLVRYLRQGEHDRRTTLPLYSGLMLVAVLTHYSTLLAVGGLVIVLIVLLCARCLNRQQCRALLIWNLPLLVAVLCLYFFHLKPRLVGSELAITAATGWLSRYMIETPADVWSGLLGVLVQVCGLGFEGPTCLLLLAGLGLAAFRRQAILVLLPVAVVCLAVLGSALGHYPFGFSRHSLYLSVFLVPPIAYAVAAGLTAGRTPAIVTAVLLAGLFFVREPVTWALGSKYDERWVTPEHVVSRTDLEDTIPKLELAASTDCVAVMSQQSYYLLMPLYHHERQQATWSKDRKLMRFTWGKCQVLVWQAWEFDIDPGRLGADGHLYHCIQKIDEMMPELGLWKNSRLLFPFGGWSSTTPTHLVGIDNLLAPGKKFVVEHAGIEGFHVLELNMPAFKACVEAELQKRKPRR
ncbi:MAG: glycosyltransferase family 39 protein [Planctomycetota bacterium]